MAPVRGTDRRRTGRPGQGAAGYPNSVIDINYAIRFVKANAAKLKTRPELVGITGTSSGVA